MKVSAISATLAFLIASASARSIEARQTSEARFLLSGFGDNNGAVPGYTLTVPEDGSVHTIHQSLVIVTIEPLPTGYDDYNCSFVGAEGYVSHLGSIMDVDGPQAQVSVTCDPVQ